MNGRDKGLVLPNSVTQALGGCDPNVVALEIDAEDVIVGRRRIDAYGSRIAVGVAHQHFRLAGFERWPVDGPVRTVVVREALVRGTPGPVAVHRFHLVHKVAGKAAVLCQEVVPAAAVVTARA